MLSQYATVTPVRHTLEKAPDFWWEIRPTTTADEITMSKFVATRRKVKNESGEVVDLPPSWIENAVREIAISFHDTNIVDDEGNPALVKGASVAQVESFLLKMPVDFVMEIWQAVGQANPLWGPRLPQKAETGLEN